MYSHLDFIIHVGLMNLLNLLFALTFKYSVIVIYKILLQLAHKMNHDELNKLIFIHYSP